MYSTNITFLSWYFGGFTLEIRLLNILYKGGRNSECSPVVLTSDFGLKSPGSSSCYIRNHKIRGSWIPVIGVVSSLPWVLSLEKISLSCQSHIKIVEVETDGTAIYRHYYHHCKNGNCFAGDTLSFAVNPKEGFSPSWLTAIATTTMNEEWTNNFNLPFVKINTYTFEHICINIQYMYVRDCIYN